tara:strand:+ start:874 stop:2688 length:1815 start_codon:yes stop_codon:yes gene_type:complete
LSKDSFILGISSFYHDSAACLLKNGEIINAVQEERFTRKKNDSSFPINSIRFILDENNLKINLIDYVVFYEKPFLKFERLLETYLLRAPIGFNSFKKAMPLWSKEKIFQKQLIIKKLNEIDETFVDKKKILFSEHHLSHAASAFYPSPFNESVVLTADGVGEWSTTTIAVAKNNQVKIKKDIKFPHSLGLLYSAFTYLCGFKVNEGEYKLMGLAPYGKPIFKDIIYEKLIDVKEDGSFQISQDYFNYATGLTMINESFCKLFNCKPRDPVKENIKEIHLNLASSIQSVIEEIILKICVYIKDTYKIDNLCLAGGVALNCVANGKILSKKIFKNIWVQPAAGDAGGALGAALTIWHDYMGKSRTVENSKNDFMKNSYLGTSFTNSHIKEKLKSMGANYVEYNSTEELTNNTVNKILDKKVIGWFQGKMEFGPRALGNRSIIADPRSLEMQKILNLKIKFRESFRPFAPVIMQEHVVNWFDNVEISKYMSFVSQIKKEKKINIQENESVSGLQRLNIKRSEVPSITHVDYSARIQTMNRDDNILFYNLLEKFYEKTNIPMLINTSFNVRDEPIVNSIEDAYSCFLKTDMDYLVIGNFILDKEEQYQ